MAGGVGKFDERICGPTTQLMRWQMIGDDCDSDQLKRGVKCVMFVMGCLHKLVERGALRSGDATITMTPLGVAQFDQMVAAMGEEGERFTLQEMRDCLLYFLTNGADGVLTEDDGDQ